MRIFVSGLLAGLAIVLQAAAPTATASGPVSFLETHTIFAVYGRAFRVAPILGRLGTYRNFASMEADTRPFVKAIASNDGGKPVVTGVDLIYAMAVPCHGPGDCLDYVEHRGNVVEEYIKPALQRGAVVILDTQLGRSDPATQIRRMIAKGYLQYENVHVAIDPEFHVYAGKSTPGTPVGTVTAKQINEAQAILNDYVASEHLATKKILIVHQFGDPAVRDGVPNMIREKKTLATYPNVELVIDADGLGSPVVKTMKYNRITSAAIYPFIQFRGIKIFFRSPLERHGHFDRPPMTIPQALGKTKVPGGGRIATAPNVIIIA